MDKFFADMHIHIGAGENGEPVKITASKELTFPNILREAFYNKGLDMIGIIDCASPVVIRDMEKMLFEGEMKELPDGGIKYEDLVLIPGAEIESREDNGGQCHYLAYFPQLFNVKEFSSIMKDYISNINLSSQSTGLKRRDILQIVDGLQGILIPAHVFTPYKSFYGRSFRAYNEAFFQREWDKIPAVELGLSADTFMADYLGELRHKTFLSNSDAHSLPKIAREYNEIMMKKPDFNEFKMALAGCEGRRVSGNYGLDPRLGKYHRSHCPLCEKTFSEKQPVLSCPKCGNKEPVVGVKDRIMDISQDGRSVSPPARPKYIHQIPLLDVPGIGPATLKTLLKRFETEMRIIHDVAENELEELLGPRLADNIIKARSGKARIRTGGGGYYGKVMG